MRNNQDIWDLIGYDYGNGFTLRNKRGNFDD